MKVFFTSYVLDLPKKIIIYNGLFSNITLQSEASTVSDVCLQFLFLSKMNKTIEESLQLNEEIYKKALTVERLQSQKDDLEHTNSLKTTELQQLKASLLNIEENQDGLTNRNTALREKFSQLDANVKIEGEKISEEMRSFFKKLGLKVTQELATGDLVELKFLFTENNKYYATFIYDSITEDYDCKFIHWLIFTIVETFNL